MVKTKEAELTSAVFLYVLRCIAESDHIALQQLKVGEREIEQLRTLGILDLYRIDSFRSHCLSISFNREVFWTLINYMKEQRDDEIKLEQLIDHDAPYSMLECFFGISNREYTQRRRAKKGLTNVGRPNEPSDSEADALLEIWFKRLKNSEKDAEGRLVDPIQYLDLANELNIPLRSVWLLTERWVELDQRAYMKKQSKKRQREP
ncbi:MAG: STY4526/YPO1902 family pathogenicity island replication protein [Gammaproteobacteria bacterium]|nr:STY4526/YPO1902 family pathogenicity island replication protein [Gammaproteobacteria bacterium]